MSRQTLLNANLSKDFKLIEFLNSAEATEHLITEQYNISEEIVDNLRDLCVNVLQPARNELGFPFTITSGYRCSRVNKLVRGSETSDHLFGKAADIQCNDNAKLFECLKKYNFKQVINEYNFAWVHISYDRNNNKKEILQIK